jgi:uncharacterized membrane protein
MTDRAVAHLVGKCVYGVMFVAAGVMHFVSPGFYMKIMPPYLPYQRTLVLLSGGIEIALGVLLLIPDTSRWAAWGLIALLIAVFPANIYMYKNAKEFSISPLILFLRLPLQGLLILWAYAYTRPRA